MSITSNNPLSKHFRQPKLYIQLPSQGRFYPQGSLEISETGEYPVLAMTAKDELMFKTPDALLNGQSTVNVIQSCIPSIKNAWNVPSIDIDAILIAIRIATYGETMDLTTRVSGIDEDRTYEADLRNMLDVIMSNSYDNVLTHNEFIFEIAPMSYKKFTEVAMKTFEEQRLFRVINDDNMSDVEKLEKFNESFNRITDLNIGQIFSSIKSIKYADEDPVTNDQFIKEFLENADKDVYKSIIEHIEKQKNKFAIQPLTVKLGEEDISNGSPETVTIPITFDQSNFFG